MPYCQASESGLPIFALPAPLPSKFYLHLRKMFVSQKHKAPQILNALHGYLQEFDDHNINSENLMHIDWIKSLGLQYKEVIYKLLYHDYTQENIGRKRRNQALHTAVHVLKLLSDRANYNNTHLYLDVGQVTKTSINTICDLTEFSRSAVKDALDLLRNTGFIRTKNTSYVVDGQRRRGVSEKYLTPVFFKVFNCYSYFMAALGVKKKNTNKGKKQTDHIKHNPDTKKTAEELTKEGAIPSYNKVRTEKDIENQQKHCSKMRDIFLAK